MSDYETVQVERRGPVGVVTLNRPDSLNAFNSVLLKELKWAVREINDDENVLVAVLTGAGRGFSAGADLLDAPSDPAHFRVEDELNGEYKPILMEITGAPKPWISAVNGAAAGVGSAFAMACDLTVMAEDAYIYQAFAAIGLVPDGGATWHLGRTLGRKRAYELMVSGEKFSAQKCLALGLCNRVVPGAGLMDAALQWADELADKSPLALRYAKQSLNEAMENSLDETISREATLQNICITSEDFQEGVAAFMDKRAPSWKGR
jgi:2-(1,2-epoxy-1,2-dihydrophenyl)acetyl-CoA isomerase